MSELLELERPTGSTVGSTISDEGLDEFETELLHDTELDKYFSQRQDQVEDQVNLNIIRERNEGMRTIATDVALLKELFMECASMVFGQGESLAEAERSIEQSVEHTEEAAKSLERAEVYATTGKGKLFDLCVMVTGIGLGSLGWIGGPWIGISTMAAGLGVSGSVVIARNTAIARDSKVGRKKNATTSKP